MVELFGDLGRGIKCGIKISKLYKEKMMDDYLCNDRNVSKHITNKKESTHRDNSGKVVPLITGAMTSDTMGGFISVESQSVAELFPEHPYIVKALLDAGYVDGASIPRKMEDLVEIKGIGKKSATKIMEVIG